MRLRSGLSAGPRPSGLPSLRLDHQGPTGQSAPGAARRGAAPSRSPSPQEGRQSAAPSAFTADHQGTLRTWVLQPAGLHRGQPVPSLPRAAGWVTPFCDAPTGRSVLPLSLLLLREGSRVLGKSLERKRRIRTGRAKPVRALPGSGGLRAPRHHGQVPQQAGGPRRAGSPRTALPRGHGPSTGPRALPSCPGA